MSMPIGTQYERRMVPIDAITSDNGYQRRAVNDAKVAELAGSIAEIGLLNPVTVDQDAHLIAGAHRLAALKLLGWTQVPVCVVSVHNDGDRLRAQLACIDENLTRSDLTQLERGEALAERKRLYLELHPETEQHTAGGVAKAAATDNMAVAPSFASDTAAKTGTSDRTIRRAVKIGTDLAPEARDAVRNTPTADNQSDLLRLARMPAEKQVVIAREVAATGKSVKQVDLEQKRAAVDAETRAERLPAVVTLADQAEWLAQYRDAPADLLVTDPPYSTDVEDIWAFAGGWLPSALACVSDHGRAYVCVGAYPEELAAYLAVGCADQRMTLQQVLVWTYRNTLGPSPTHTYKQNWQAILYFTGPDAAPLSCPLMSEQFAVQDVNAPDGRLGDRYHAWQKPDELAERLIRHATKPGDLVIDPFCGTGTFVLAAGRLGRIGAGCDLDAAMIAQACERGCQRGDSDTSEADAA